MIVEQYVSILIPSTSTAFNLIFFIAPNVTDSPTGWKLKKLSVLKEDLL